MEKETKVAAVSMKNITKTFGSVIANDKVNLDIYNVTTEELKNSQVSPEVMAAFDERHAVLRSCKKTVVDHVAGHIALTFELVYPISLQIAKERGYLDKMMAFESDNEVTGKQFEEIRAKLNEYVASVRPL